MSLTTAEQREIVTAGDKWRRSVYDEHLGDLFAAVERIVKRRTDALDAECEHWAGRYRAIEESLTHPSTDPDG